MIVTCYEQASTPASPNPPAPKFADPKASFKSTFKPPTASPVPSPVPKAPTLRDSHGGGGSTGSASSGNVDLQSFKEEILSEVRVMLQQMKEEILASLH